jgi:selenocysteine lyase/cysteine desulfurase
VRNLLKITAKHIRIGTVGGLLILDSIAVALVIIDVGRYADQFSLSLIRMAHLLELQDLVPFAAVLLLWTCGIPAVLAMALVLAQHGRGVTTWLGLHRPLVTILHVFSGLLLAMFAATMPAAEVLAGYEFRPHSIAEPSFHFILAFIATSDFIAQSTALLIAVVGAVVGAWLWESYSRGKPTVASKYTSGLELADLAGALQPRHGRRVLNFNAAAIAPELRGVRRSLDESFRRYQLAGPGSPRSEDILRATTERAADHLRAILPSLDSRPIRFCSNTSRALEFVIRSVPEPRTIILSPFEHESEHAVANWVASTSLATDTIATPSNEMQMALDDCARAWAVFKARLYETVEHAASEGHTPAVLVSEVWWLSGQKLPISELFADDRLKDSRIIVDGAHGAGNLREPITVPAPHVYVFGGHKWLLASDPIGVAVSDDPLAFDTVERMSQSTAAMRSIAALEASLELVRRLDFEMLHQRRHVARSVFCTAIDEKFEIIGAASEWEETSLLALRPRPGLSWVIENATELRTFFAKHRLSVFVGQTPLFVRVSFSHFVTQWEVLKAARILKNAVE